ncbi:SURF1 family protein [Hyphomicrobium sp. LHD-15]|uniref:SURF1 family protein n=1 Tax=Hyphomicrobium sp. LHD-15 TaxID=3072142 RepID=UPI00281062DF|nr:SURF1 family protein [Hyphomicrobium sp. LHD-15]MDQ8699349.1 SURF1 family protein [Hyphomicrobium sp. LHD-15]
MTTSHTPNSQPARRGGIVVATVMTLIALPILIGLGVWQLERKAWKESLLTAIAERTKQEPVDLLGTYSATHESDLGFEYVRAKVRGRFLNDKERYFYAPDQKLGPGYHVYTPLEIAGTTAVVFVNRGFVTEDLKDPAKRREGQLDGEVEVVGLLRGPGIKATFTPDNDPKANLWFWRDYAGLFASAFSGTDRTAIAAFLDAEAPAPGGWPKGGATLVELPNRHLEYALTWFGLAVTLVAIFGVFAWTRRRATPPERG